MKNVYKVFGYAYGSFKDQKDPNNEIQFQYVMLGEPITFPERSNAVYDGYNVKKRRCENLVMFNGIEVGDWVMAFLDNAVKDENRKVSYMVKLTPEQIAEYDLE